MTAGRQYVNSVRYKREPLKPVIEIYYFPTQEGDAGPGALPHSELEVEMRQSMINWHEPAVETLDFKLTEYKKGRHGRTGHRKYFSVAVSDLENLIKMEREIRTKKDTR